jgi:hypothetical protein
MKTSLILLMSLCIVSGLMTGCSTHYTTPAGGVSVAELADEDIEELYKREPASPFPARLAVVRVQDSGYTSKTSHGYGSGRYTIVTTRDIESDEDFKLIQELPMIVSVAPLSRLLVPVNANTLKDLRIPAARLKADLLLLYSVDTKFNVEGTPLGPLSLISLGFLPNKKAFVTSTVSGALIDVRTGYIYGTSEATETEEQRASMWSTEDAIDAARIRAERQAFLSFSSEFKRLWKNISEQYTNKG